MKCSATCKLLVEMRWYFGQYHGKATGFAISKQAEER